LLWPQVDVRIAIGLCKDLRERVARAELDAALTIEGGAAALSSGETVAVWPARLRFVVSPRHPLTQGAVRRRDLEARTFLLADAEGAFNDLLKAWAGGLGAQLRLESAGSIDGVKRGVLNSDAIGVLPDYAVAEELAAHTLDELNLDDTPPPVALRLTTLKSPQAGSPLAGLIRQIREAVPVKMQQSAS
jgi:DNA-binding transcriptional LysR family regulator